MADLEIDTDTLVNWLAATYGLANIRCAHVRSHSNHTYIITSGMEHYILKLYGGVMHTRQEISWEIDLLDHIAKHGGSVSKAVPAQDGSGLGRYEQYDAVLFEYAPGDKPTEPFTANLYYREGRSLAAVHRAADSFVPAYSRVPLDVDYLITEPVAYTLSVVTNADDKEFLKQFAQRITDRITAFAEEGLEWGPIHGDATLDNFHVTPGGDITWYDFDSGGPGWRAYDLQGWALLENMPEFLERREAFLKGYQEIKEISPRDLAVSPYLHIAQEIWGLGLYLKRRASEGSASDITQKFIDEYFESLRKRASQLVALEQRLS